ncbi:MAG: hypothetical protein DRP81_03565 [Candidatus Omnitrophota bacterium]|nr:F0F1 ATP synthase subunit gamma [Candidatus Omnitrophota bacterium]RKY45526.1 MAG: hypothetical protein DRP81_03565 [Candidatus Omnitrophota bacterium]
MPVLSQIKKDIEFYQGLHSLLKVLKGIAISQYHMWEKKLQPFEVFSHYIEGFLGGINLEEINHPFIIPPTKTLAVVAVTSDAGLLGGLNREIVNRALDEIKEGGVFIVVGERGKLYAQGRVKEVVAFEGIKDDTKFNQAIELRNYLIGELVNGRIGVVKIVYPRAYSLAVQRIEKEILLPYGLKEKESYLQLEDFILESSIERIVEYLVFLWLGRKLYDIFNMSRLAEFAARFLHLEECTQKLEDMDQKLKFKYFRLQHEITDRSIREIFAGRLNYGYR